MATNFERGGVKLSTMAVSLDIKNDFKKLCVNLEIDMRQGLEYLLNQANLKKIKIPKIKK